MLTWIKNRQLFTLQGYNFMRQLSLLLSSVIIAKAEVATHLIAGFETAMLLAASFNFFVIAGVSHSLYPLVGKLQIGEDNVYFGQTFILLFFSGLAAGACTLITGAIMNLSYGYLWFVWPALYVVLNSASFSLEHFLIIRHQYKRTFLWGFISFSAQVAAVLYPLIIKQNLLLCLQMLVAVALVRFACTILVFYFYKIHFVFKKAPFSHLVNLSWPVMLSLLAGTGFLYANQFVVKWLGSDIDFALYRYGTKEFPLFAILTNSFSSVISASMAGASFAKISELINKSINRLCHQVFPIAILLMLSSKYLFKILLNSDLSPSWLIFNIFLLVVPSKLVFPQSVLLSMHKTNYLLKASIAESFAGLILGITGMYIGSIAGMAAGITMAYFIEKMLLLHYCSKEGFGYLSAADNKLLVVYSLLLALSFVWSMVG